MRYHALIATTAILLLGILYSVLYGTYIDTSDPLLTHLAHLLPLFTYSTSSLAAHTKRRIAKYPICTTI